MSRGAKAGGKKLGEEVTADISRTDLLRHAAAVQLDPLDQRERLVAQSLLAAAGDPETGLSVRDAILTPVVRPHR